MTCSIDKEISIPQTLEDLNLMGCNDILIGNNDHCFQHSEHSLAEFFTVCEMMKINTHFSSNMVQIPTQPIACSPYITFLEAE
jgi:hypothetical protein